MSLKDTENPYLVKLNKNQVEFLEQANFLISNRRHFQNESMVCDTHL